METACFVCLIDKLGTEAMEDLNQWLREELRNQGSRGMNIERLSAPQCDRSTA